jgi:hypothetical protein
MDSLNTSMAKLFGLSPETVEAIDRQAQQVREIRIGSLEPDDDAPICAACGGAITSGVCDDCVESAIKMLSGGREATL